MAMKGEITVESLDQLFEDQMRRLDGFKCPPEILICFWRAKQRIIDRVMETRIGQHDDPFVLVIPKTLLGSREQMKMIEYGKESGTIGDVDLREIRDCFKTPARPYCLIAPGINGRLRKHNVQRCLASFQENEKTALTSTELIALALHSTLFERHQGCFAGASRFNTGKIPTIHVANGFPTLSWEFIYANKWQWVTPYCRDRLPL